MELYQLGYFIEIARQRSFTRAAGRLHMAQPALSQQMKNLEAELGTPLFNRGRKEVQLTAAGKAFLPRAEGLLTQAEAAFSQQQMDELTRLVGTVDTFAATPQVQLPTKSDLALQARLTGTMMAYDWMINGRPFDQTVPLTIHQGQDATLTFTNQTMMWHPMHLHGHTFQVIKADGTPGPRKDTVIVKPMQTVAVKLVADNPGVWMLHCHNAYHMDAGMMTTLNYTS